MPKIVGLDKGNVILQGDRPTLYLNYDKQQMGGYKMLEQRHKRFQRLHYISLFADH